MRPVCWPTVELHTMELLQKTLCNEQIYQSRLFENGTIKTAQVVS